MPELPQLVPVTPPKQRTSLLQPNERSSRERAPAAALRAPTRQSTEGAEMAAPHRRGIDFNDEWRWCHGAA